LEAVNPFECSTSHRSTGDGQKHASCQGLLGPPATVGAHILTEETPYYWCRRDDLAAPVNRRTPRSVSSSIPWSTPRTNDTWRTHLSHLSWWMHWSFMCTKPGTSSLSFSAGSRWRPPHAWSAVTRAVGVVARADEGREGHDC
jgi:hypothetical protein